MTAKFSKQTIQTRSIKIALFTALLISPQIALADHGHNVAEAHKNNQEMQEQMQHGDHRDMKNPRHVIDGVMTGGQPSEADFEHFKDNGYSTIINLRAEGEFDEFDEQQLVEDMSMDYISIPIAGGEDFTMDNILKLDAALKNAEGKVVLHCGSGNRVGAILALKAFHVDGMSEDEAMALGIAAGMTNLAPAIRGLIKTAE